MNNQNACLRRSTSVSIILALEFAPTFLEDLIASLDPFNRNRLKFSVQAPDPNEVRVDISSGHITFVNDLERDPQYRRCTALD